MATAPNSTSPCNSGVDDSKAWADSALERVLGTSLKPLRPVGAPEAIALEDAIGLSQIVDERFELHELDEHDIEIRWKPPEPISFGRSATHDPASSALLAHQARLLGTDALKQLAKVHVIASVECTSFAAELERFNGLKSSIEHKIHALVEALGEAPDETQVDLLFASLLGELGGEQGLLKDLRETALPDGRLSSVEAESVRTSLRIMIGNLKCIRETWDAKSGDDTVAILGRLRTAVRCASYSVSRAIVEVSSAHCDHEYVDLLPIPVPRDDPNPETQTLGVLLGRSRSELRRWTAELRDGGVEGARGMQMFVERLKIDVHRARLGLDEVVARETEVLQQFSEEIVVAVAEVARGEATPQASRKRKRVTQSRTIPAPPDPLFLAVHQWIVRLDYELAETAHEIERLFDSTTSTSMAADA